MPARAEGLDEGLVRSHVDQVVRESIEQTFNGLLNRHADNLSKAPIAHQRRWSAFVHKQLPETGLTALRRSIQTVLFLGDVARIALLSVASVWTC